MTSRRALWRHPRPKAELTLIQVTEYIYSSTWLQKHVVKTESNVMFHYGESCPAPTFTSYFYQLKVQFVNVNVFKLNMFVIYETYVEHIWIRLKHTRKSLLVLYIRRVLSLLPFVRQSPRWWKNTQNIWSTNTTLLKFQYKFCIKILLMWKCRAESTNNFKIKALTYYSTTESVDCSPWCRTLRAARYLLYSRWRNQFV